MKRNEEVFYTQKELASRWKISEGCVKKWRDKGIIPFFRLQGSSRILFPVKEVKKIEEKNTTIAKGV